MNNDDNSDSNNDNNYNGEIIEKLSLFWQWGKQNDKRQLQSIDKQGQKKLIIFFFLIIK